MFDVSEIQGTLSSLYVMIVLILANPNLQASLLDFEPIGFSDPV